MTKTAIDQREVQSSKFKVQSKVKGCTIIKILKEAEDELRAHEIQNPRLNAESLLSMILKIDRVGLYTEYDRTLTKEETEGFLELVERRLRREPLQYILGNCEFFGLEFLVSPDVLIPRPETEFLVEEAINRVKSYALGVMSKDKKENSGLNILDLCTGSGCIAITLAKKLRGTKIYAVDISDKALSIAKKNARRHGVEERIKFLQGNLFEPFSSSPKSYLFNLVISNPPYIPSQKIDSLQPEVRDYEPREALNGGPDGLLHLRKIIEEAPQYLQAGGGLLLEIGYDQRERILKIIEEKGRYLRPEFIKDCDGFDRVVVAIKN